MANSEIIFTRQGPHGSFKVQMEGLDAVMRGLKRADAEMHRTLVRGLKRAAQPVLSAAKARASAIADDGTFAGSLSLGTRANGSSIVLKSSDEAAGVKEFANQGAVYRPRPDDKRRNARKMAVFPVGVPRRANAPRAMVPAVNDNVERVAAAMDEEIGRLLGGCLG